MLKIDFNKGNGLVPAVVQDVTTMQVLMVGYMNKEALDKTLSEGKVTFFSRSRNELWTKGESSGNYLIVKEIKSDCDCDTILVMAEPQGPVCHTGKYSCFGEEQGKGFIYRLEKIINERITGNVEQSYTNKLFRKGINKIVQKVGEEAVELIIEAKDNNKDLFMNETADLLYHLLILLKAKDVSFERVEALLLDRHKT